MPQQSSSRVAYLDVLRLGATFAVIFLHVSANRLSSLYPTMDWYTGIVGDSLVRWAVPIFVMISGALFLNPNKDVSIRNVLTKRIPRLLMVYLFWWAAYTAIRIAYASLRAHGLTIGLYMFQPHFHLWFLPMLMCVYLLIPLLRLVARDEKVLRYALVVWLAYCTVSFLFNTFESEHTLHQVRNLFRGDMVIRYAGYFLLGYHLATHTFSRRTRLLIYTLGAIGAAMTIGGNIFWSHHLGEGNDQFMCNTSLHVILMSGALFVGVKHNAHHWSKVTTPLLNHTKKDLFGIYLVHGIYLLLLNHPAIYAAANHMITVPLYSIVIFICSLYTTKMIRLVPGLRKVVE